MKKLLMSLLSLSLVSSIGAEVVACNNNADLYSTVSFGEKISSLKQISGSLLQKSGIQVSSFYNQQVLDDFVNGVKIGIFGSAEDPVGDDDGSKAALFNKLEENARGIFFANDFLYQVGKVPGYHWVTERLRVQSTKFNLFYKGDELGLNWNVKDLDIFTRFVSSWMGFDDWGLSVTFFDANKDPWHGDDNPAFARINVNQRAVSVNGKIDPNESIQNAIHLDKNGKEYPIYPSLEDQGYIYQGYVYGTDLIDMSGILSETENESAQIDLLSYTPSAFDIINNTMSNATVDDIINSFSDDFKKDVDDMLNNNPIYLGDETDNKKVVARFSNVALVSLFKAVLTRREMEDDHWKGIYAKLEELSKEDDIKISVITRISDNVWDDISAFLKQSKLTDDFSTPDYTNDQYKNDIQLLQDWKEKDYNDSTKDNKDIESHIDELSAALNRLIWNTRTAFDDEEQYNVCVSRIINVLPFFYQGTDLSSIKRLDNIDLTEYGNNNDYNFAELIFGSSSDINNMKDPNWITEHAKQLYSPDLGTTRPKMADRGFKNVSVRKRFIGNDSLFSKYNQLMNLHYRTWMLEYGDDSVVATSPLSPGAAKNVSEKYDVSNPTNVEWFNEAFESLLKQNKIEGHGEEINLQMLGQNYDSNIRALVQKYFTFDESSKSMLIWNLNNGNDYSLSSDRSLKGDDNKHGAIKYDPNNPFNYDDDIAFSDVAGMNSKINGYNNPLYATEWTNVDSDGKTLSQFRSRVLENGFNDHPYAKSDGINPVEFKIIIGSVNSYGEMTSEQNNYARFTSQPSIINNAESYVSFVQTDFRDKDSAGQPYADAVRKFWEYWVWKNPDKEGVGYNPNAGERPNYDN